MSLYTMHSIKLNLDRSILRLTLDIISRNTNDRFCSSSEILFHRKIMEYINIVVLVAIGEVVDRWVLSHVRVDDSNG